MSQVANTLKQSFIRHYRITLAPGQETERAITGVYFMVAEQEGGGGFKFEASIDDLGFFAVTLGLKFTLTAGNSFSKLRFRNPTAETITFEIYAGTVEGEDMRLNIVRGRAAPIMHAETVITGHGGTINAAAEIDLAGTEPNPKFIRKATIVTNMDPAVDLEVLNQADEILDTVFFRSSKLYESSDSLKVKNNTGAPVVCRISQIWYELI